MPTKKTADVLREEILWSVLKGHGGSRAITARLLTTAPHVLKHPDLTQPADRKALRDAAQSERACPAVNGALQCPDPFVRGIVTAKEFLEAHSVNPPHDRIEAIAKARLAREQAAGSLSSWDYFQSVRSGCYGDPTQQGVLVWDGSANDPNDFQRTLWLERDGNWMIVEGINRSTALAAAVLEKALDPETPFAVYMVP